MALNDAHVEKEKHERKRFNILIHCITGVNPDEQSTTPEEEFRKLQQALTKTNG